MPNSTPPLGTGTKAGDSLEVLQANGVALRIGGWWKLGFPLTVTGGEFPFFYSEGQFFSIGLYLTEKPFFL